MLKPMGYQSPNPLPAAHKKLTAHKRPAAKNEGPTYRPKLNFVSSRWELCKRYWNLMGFMARPPNSPFHNSRLRAGLRSLCKYNFDRKDYSNQETKQNEILATFTKHTKKIEKKTNEDANANGDTNAVLISTGIKPREAKPALPAPLLDETASFEDKTASSENFSANSNGNADALLVSTGTKPSEMEPAPPVSFVNKTASSGDIYFDASDKKTSSEDIPNHHQRICCCTCCGCNFRIWKDK
jgi:hypothetical protein